MCTLPFEAFCAFPLCFKTFLSLVDLILGIEVRDKNSPFDFTNILGWIMQDDDDMGMDKLQT